MNRKNNTVKLQSKISVLVELATPVVAGDISKCSSLVILQQTAVTFVRN